ncbi:Transcription activator of gluconeoproteinsis ERT1 [Elsinoe australis]|uniref:Transcription activator of gluconeoproteinsis ERT1 n=1 Tax=Elsinoe australis TaxID=40998 RepID=A0A2P8AFV6_9PEZI|nr:Transcription activator of gluconeoproteinsis ERT1 [Elsinoe australis]
MSKSHQWPPHFPEATAEAQKSGSVAGDQGHSKPEGNTQGSATTFAQPSPPIHAITHSTTPTSNLESQLSHLSSPSLQADESTSVGRPGRRPKATALTACNNCKRAHLGCDVGRPCSRCILSGKQDTCADVPQKKRGRPRLRGESSAGSRGSKDETALQVTAGAEDGSSRHDLPESQASASGHRRADSMRSLMSTESSVASASLISPISSRDQTDPFARMLGLGPSRDTGPIVPTAWLDFDLNILKTDDHFSRIFSNWQLLGRRLPDIAVPSTPDLFHNLRTKLRDERESKDPAYLPPIAVPGEDPLGPMDNVNVAEATHGFDALHYQLSYTFASGMTQTLATKFNLARTSRYFIIMSLPPLTRDFFAVVVGQASRAQEASVPPVIHAHAPFQIMTMFSDSRVADALSPGTSSPSDSPIDDLNAETQARKTGAGQASTAVVEQTQPQQNQSAPLLQTPQHPHLRRQQSAKTEPPTAEEQRLQDAVSAGPSSVSTPYSTSEFGIARSISNESAIFSDDETCTPRSRPTIENILNTEPASSNPDWRPQSSGSSRKASQQGRPRESDKKRRMDIGSLLHDR